jgi:hydroxypyruvate reductase
MTDARDLLWLRRAAREIFDAALVAADARRATLEAIRFEDSTLSVCGAEIARGVSDRGVYSIALGKAGARMASALDERLGHRLARGVVSAPTKGVSLSERWRVFEGGHPLPNEASFAAGRAALELLREADEAAALVIFLVSGGGSAMLEWPRDSRLTLEDLRETNRALVACGATISEVNAVRRALSAVKGGGLAAAAGRAAQITLIVSDTNAGRERDVASGPTLAPGEDETDPREVIARHGLSTSLPASVLRAIGEAKAVARQSKTTHESIRESFVLLDNRIACEAAAATAHRLGFAIEMAPDLVEQHVAQGSVEMVELLVRLYRASKAGQAVGLISGGEFACPVRGAGMGGRNAETALRCAFEFEKVLNGRRTDAGGASTRRAAPRELLALCAGTDGVDGNSPAAGALADGTTLARARTAGLSPQKHLDESDAYTLFDALGDAIVTGPTGTNVRDLRVLLAA